MSTEPIDKSSKNKKYWVSFSKRTGAISSVGKQEPTVNDRSIQVVQLDDPVLKQFARGKKNTREYIIAWNVLSDSWGVSKKKDELELQPLRNRLEQIEKSEDPTLHDIYISLYKRDMKAVISVNTSNIIKNYNLSKINNIVHNEFSLMNLFVCRKDDPDFLLGVLEIDAMFLMQHKKLVFDLPHDLLSAEDFENVSFFTIPVFDSYGLQYLEDFVNTPDLSGDKKIVNHSSTNQDAKINIYKVNENTIKLDSKLKTSEFNLFDGRKELVLVVCDTEVDNLLGGVYISVNDLLSKTSLDVELKFKIPENPIFLYKNNNISVSYNGEKHEQLN